MGRFQSGGGVEKKFLDTTVTLFTDLTATASVTLLNGLSQGTTQSTRVGGRIEVKSVQFKVNFQNGTNVSGVSPLRIKIIYDKETNGAAPAATDVMAVNLIDGLNNLNNAGRFITLFDQTWNPVVGPGTSAVATNYQAQFLDGYVKCNLPTKYNAGNTGTVTDISSGSIYVLAWTNGFGFAGTGSDASGYFRIRYTDI